MVSRNTCRIAVCSLVLLIAPIAAAAEPVSVTRLQALRTPPPAAAGTWAVLDRDGAGRQVEPYLSSLAGGEAGTGSIASPALTLSVPSITFSLRGHDGQSGGRGQNFIALLDADGGDTLVKTPAPGSDELQQRSWDVQPWQGRRVRIEVHDGDAGGAFAWLGVGSISAGPALNVDFRSGLPDGWKITGAPVAARDQVIGGGIPFRRDATVYSLVPATGTLELPCGFTARRLFFLGCTVARGVPLEQYGTIELAYSSGASQVFPLIYGYTLDGEGKRLSLSPALHLHASSDPFQHYLAIQPRDEILASIRLSRDPQQEPLPRITAITCETAETAQTLVELPGGRPSAEEQAWLGRHTISAGKPQWKPISEQIRRDHRVE